MDDDIKIITWEDILSQAGRADHGPQFIYNGVDLVHSVVLGQAEEWLAKQKLVTKAVEAAMSGHESLYFRVTAGRNAGTIMRLVNPKVFERHDRYGSYRRYKSHSYPSPSQKPTLIDDQGYHKGSGAIYIDGHYFMPSGKDFRFQVDGQKKDFVFERGQSANKTMKPELLLGYKGPTVWQAGKPVKKAITIKDRYGRDVTVGDVVLLGQSLTGRLVAGKITRLTEARGIWIKHIGSSEDCYEKSVANDQIMLLKDIEKVLMMEKLKSL